MAPTEPMEPESGDLGKDSLQEIVTRLKEVRRRCADEPGVGDGRNKAVDGLDAVLSNLYQSLKPGSETTTAEDLSLRLAAVEELFEAMGSRGLARVITNIRSSLTESTEESSQEDEPPPPRRFEPPPSSAVRRRRPRPESHEARTPAPEATRRGGFGWLILTILIGGGIAVTSVLVLRQVDLGIEPSDPAARGATEAPLTMPAAAAPTRVPGPVEDGEEFESHEEDMAQFTLEIHLAESTLQDGDLNTSLRHFAAAAAIDRHHRRVVDVGKNLIAALLQEADLAHDNGDSELAGRRVQNARNIARGLRLDDSSIDKTVQKHAVLTRFEDTTPHDGAALRRAVGHPVRLTLKTRDVIFGHLKEIQDDILMIDVYSGVKGGRVEFSTSILSSTIKEVRVYDAKLPSETMTEN